MKNKLLFLFLLSTQVIWAQEKSDDLTRWTPSDIIHTEYMQNVTISPDNSMVAWTKRRGYKEEDKFISDLYLTRLDQEDNGDYTTIRLTFADENDHSPLFSKDSKYLYFLSTRDKSKKLWRLNLSGGEAEEVHEFKTGISSLDWINDSTLIFKSNEGKTLYEQELEEKKDDVVVVEDSVHWKADRLYAFDIKKKEINRLTENEKPVGSYAISRNGEWLVYNVMMSRHYSADANPDPQYYLKNMSTNVTDRILEDRDFPSRNFQFTPDHAGFYFQSDTASDPKWNGAGLSQLFYYDLAQKQYKEIPLDWELGIGRSYYVVPGGIFVELANKATFRLAFYQKDGDSWEKQTIELGDKNDHCLILAASEDGSKIIHDYSTASTLPKYFVVESRQNTWTNSKELVKLNKKLIKKPMAKSEVLIWSGYQDEEVTGILYYPEDYDATKKYPLILSIHGGPAGVDTDRWSERWSTYPNILTQRGSFVLKPNYHGSSNHGLAYVEAIKGNYYDPELKDIISGIELLARQGKIDTTQMGVMGWSNGAILTTMLTVRYPDMFTVACPGAGDVNWTSDYGTCRFGVSFDQSYFGGAPWDDRGGKYYNEEYIRLSPLFELEKVQTPTIIFHGSEDRAVPRDQGWEYYRALQQAGQAPVRFLWFPKQPHGLQKISHQLRKMQEELTWIDTYLFDKESEKNESFKEESPLAYVLKRNALQKQADFFGTHTSGVLSPEMVTLNDSLEVAVLEITNAQWKAFRPAFEYPENEDNFPVIVSHEEIDGYIDWLSEAHQASYRLPSEEEAKEFHELARKNPKSENTLNKWAGYDMTREDAHQLMEKLEGSHHSLIQEVAQAKPIKYKNVDLFDLGGNVAEYHQGGGHYGYDAAQFVDPRDPDNGSSRFIGFRIVKEIQ